MRTTIYPDLWVWAGLAAVVGPYLFWRGFRDLRLKRLMDNTPTSHIRSMAMGLVELEGDASPRSQVFAPFSGRECAYWEVDIATRNNRRGGWTVVHRNHSGNPFYLRDATGVALVYPQGADCRLNFGVSEECLGVSLPACYAEYLDQQNLRLAGLWRLGAMRFRERLIEQGQHVFVLGSAVPRSKVLNISNDEIEAATGTDGLRAARLQSIDHEVVGTVRKGENEPTFLISEQSERTLSAFTGWRAGAELIGGPLLTLFGLSYWLDTLSHGALFR